MFSFDSIHPVSIKKLLLFSFFFVFDKTISYFTTASNAGDYPVLAKLTTSYDVKKAAFSGSIEFKDAPQCVLDFMASSSLWVKVSFLTLVSILLF